MNCGMKLPIMLCLCIIFFLLFTFVARVYKHTHTHKEFYTLILIYYCKARFLISLFLYHKYHKLSTFYFFLFLSLCLFKLIFLQNQKNPEKTRFHLFKIHLYFLCFFSCKLFVSCYEITIL